MIEFPVVLVINCGSSSVKFSVLDAESSDVLLSGIADGVQTENLSLSVNGGEPEKLTHSSYGSAFKAIVAELEKRELTHSVVIVGHRIAHGGSEFKESILITEAVTEKLRQVSSMAPLHNGANLCGVKAAQHHFPGVPQVAVFDTSFHQTLKPEAYLYALPYRYFEEWGVRRYGFHGTSYRYVTQQAKKLYGLPENAGLVIAHLGNGASVCAVQDGVSVDTSMGMTPLEGLMMGTRCGDMDIGALAWIGDKTSQTLSDLEQVLNNESGLLGISGISSDLRVLTRHKDNPRAELAINTFVHRIARHIGGHAMALKHIDAIIFTGGIGENSAPIRESVMARLQALGVVGDEAKNRESGNQEIRVISASDSKVLCAVIPTNEEKMIALDAMQIVGAVGVNQGHC